jgi:hypothetical protein
MKGVPRTPGYRCPGPRLSCVSHVHFTKSDDLDHDHIGVWPDSVSSPNPFPTRLIIVQTLVYSRNTPGCDYIANVSFSPLVLSAGSCLVLNHWKSSSCSAAGAHPSSFKQASRHTGHIQRCFVREWRNLNVADIDFDINNSLYSCNDE